MQCRALITKEFKTVKADSRYPPEPFTNPDMLPICGGKLRFEIRSAYYYDSSEVKVEVECSRCKYPYFRGIYSLWADPEATLAKILNGDQLVDDSFV